jgi:hypothetical protein
MLDSKATSVNDDLTPVDSEVMQRIGKNPENKQDRKKLSTFFESAPGSEKPGAESTETHSRKIRIRTGSKRSRAKPDPLDLVFDEERVVFMPKDLDRYVNAFQVGEELTTIQF